MAKPCSKIHAIWLVVIPLGLSIFLVVEKSAAKGVFPEIRITVSEAQFRKLQEDRGTSLELKHTKMTIDGDSAKVKDAHSRGNNSLFFRRKSLSIDLKHKVRIESEGRTVSLKRFNLLNLVMDKNLWHNRWSFLTMATLGIFPVFNTYCTVWINNSPQGIYLLVEKPQYATAGLKSPYTIRRGIDHGIDHEYEHHASRVEIREYRKQYQSLYRTGSLSGRELYEHYNESINLEAYFRWIGFNFLVMNGDYTDELFLYIDPNTKRFKVIGWDYDDLLLPQPHEGAEARNAIYADRMIFSLEDPFDKTIASDDYVYSSYLDVLRQLLLDCDTAVLVGISKKVLKELEVLSNDPTNCRATLYLDKEPFDIQNARVNISNAITFLVQRRNSLLHKLR